MKQKAITRLLSILLMLTLALGLLTGMAAADDTAQFSFASVEMKPKDLHGNDLDETIILQPNHVDKTLVAYVDAFKYALNSATYTAKDAAGNVLSNIQIIRDATADKNAYVNTEGYAELAVSDSSSGKTAAYTVYLVKRGSILNRIEYESGKNSLGPLYDTINTFENPTQTEFTSGEGLDMDADVMANSALRLNGLLGEIVDYEPKNAITLSQTKRSATVNWLKAGGTISLTFGNFPE